VAVGDSALVSNTTASSNSAFGSDALNGNTTGANNTAIGNGSLISNTTGGNNVAVGYQAGYSNLTAANNVFLGLQSGYSATGGFNTYVGNYAGYSTSTGTYNVFLGYGSGYNAASGTGSYNTCVGPGAGGAITTGSNNVIIGGYTGSGTPISATGSSTVVLSDGTGDIKWYYGTRSGVTAHYFLAMLNSAGNFPMKWNSTTGAMSYDTSSRLVKENIIDSPYGLAEIMQLKSRKYFRTDDQRSEVGLVADEVADVLPELVPMVPKSVFTKNEEDTEVIAGGVNYDKLTSVLIKAVQELKTIVDAQAAEIAELKAKVA
jgi:hypothetical protein